MIKFERFNRWTGKLQFTAEIDCAEDADITIKIGLAVKWAIRTRANLAGADLSRADLSGADLSRADLSRADLSRAYLSGADLSRADLSRADLSGAYLSRAHLSRAYLSRADLFGADLFGAELSRAELSRADLSRADLFGADLSGADLSGADLSRADLFGADLFGADLSGADLSRADLSRAYKIEEKDIPVILNIDDTILAAIESGGTLDMSDWHGSDGWCGTTHCRAGWAVHLAGQQGKALEDKYGTQRAGALIYRASRPGKPTPWFFAPDDKAMEDIRRCAAEQRAKG
jgi:Pentapeptide repeats (8 copies)